PLPGQLLVARPLVPHLHRLVNAPRGDALAIGGERHARDGARVPLQGELLPSRVGVPHLHLAPALAGFLIIPPTPRGDALTIGGERHAIDPAGLPLEGEGLLSGLHLPHLHLAPKPACLRISTAAARDDELAVGTERHALDGTGVPLETADLLVIRQGGGVPAADAEWPVVGALGTAHWAVWENRVCGRQPAAVSAEEQPIH